MPTGPESLKNLLGSKENVLKCIKQVRANYQNKPEIKKMARKQAQGIIIFMSKAQMQIWDYCMANNVNFETWMAEYIEIMGNAPDSKLFSNPRTVLLDHKNELPLSAVNEFISGDLCRICWNEGFAYLIMGPILLNGQPGNLVRTPCWCKRK